LVQKPTPWHLDGSHGLEVRGRQLHVQQPRAGFPETVDRIDEREDDEDLVAAELRTVSDATAHLVDADGSDALTAPDTPTPSDDPAAGLAEDDPTDEDS
jgi:hypothetical protein